MRRAAAMIGIASRAPDTTSRVFAGARSVCMARRARQPRDWRATLTGRIAAYALGEDYHARVGALLDALAARLAAAFPGARFQGYVDTGPVLEREWAMRAGLGWICKHTLLLDRAAGSYFFLA